MKAAYRPMAIALAFVALVANAWAEAPTEEPLRTFLPKCDSSIDDCRAMLNDFIVGGMRISNNPEPTCIPLERNKAADMMLANLHDLVRDSSWAEEPYGNALMQAMTDAFPCLTD